MVKKILTFLGLLLTAVLSLHIMEIEPINGVRFKLGFLDALERNVYDLRVKLSARSEPDPRVVIVDLDNRSLQEQGQWPWPRALFAELNDRLFADYKVATIGYDITFPEPEARYTDKQVAALVEGAEQSAELLTRLRENSGDQAFARSLTGRPIVLGSTFELAAGQGEKLVNAGALPKPVFAAADIPYEVILQETDAPRMDHYISNIPMLVDAAVATGFFSIAQAVGDPDGIIRRVELLNEYNGKLYGSLALRMFETYTAFDADSGILFDEVQPLVLADADDGYFGLEALRFLYGDVPINSQAAVYVPYAQANTTYEYIPATDIINGTYTGDITDTIVLVGTSAPGLVDLRNTPVAASMPGVEVHANVLSGMLNEDGFRIKPYFVKAADLIAVISAGLLLSLLLPRLSAFWATVVFILTMSTALASNWFFWTQKSMILTLAPVLFIIASLYIINMVVGFFAETNARRSTQKMFGLYVPPEVVGQISETKDIFSMKPEKKELTVLFTDIRDFTTVSEGMQPEELSEWMNDFLTPMTKIIHDNGGAIDKYMGDCIMAFWGAPIEDPEHAAHGIKAAVEMIAYLETLNNENRAKHRPEVRIGIGLNTGLMSVGNMGSEFRMAYTVLGDAVNLGARLESITKEYGVDICISEFTRAQAPAGYQYTELDTVKVKGKNEAVTIFSVTPLRDQ